MRITNLLLLFPILVLVGCATTQTGATLRTTTEDGFVEELEFASSGTVTWGSKQDLHKGDMMYNWEGGSFAAGGEAVGQVSADPITELTADLLKTLIDRAIPPPTPLVTAPPELVPFANGQTPEEWLLQQFGAGRGVSPESLQAFIDRVQRLLEKAEE